MHPLRYPHDRLRRYYHARHALGRTMLQGSHCLLPIEYQLLKQDDGPHQ